MSIKVGSGNGGSDAAYATISRNARKFGLDDGTGNIEAVEPLIEAGPEFAGAADTLAHSFSAPSWNGVKNFAVTATETTDMALTLSDYVHVDADLRRDKDGADLTVENAKRGSFLFGKGDDDFSLSLLSNSSGWSNQFHIKTGGGNDHVVISAGEARAGASVTDGQYSTININLGRGDDNFDASEVAASVHVLGRGGEDVIITGSGNDYLDGGRNDDILKAGAGDDILVAGKGNDELWGGEGDDIFVFTGKKGTNIIHDFEEGDKIDLSAMEGVTAEDLIFSDAGDGFVRIDIDGQKTAILLKGNIEADLPEPNFAAPEDGDARKDASTQILVNHSFFDVGDRAKTYIFNEEGSGQFGMIGTISGEGNADDLLKEIFKTNDGKPQWGEDFIDDGEHRTKMDIFDAEGNASDDFYALIEAAMQGQQGLSLDASNASDGQLDVYVEGKWSTDILRFEGGFVDDAVDALGLALEMPSADDFIFA